MRSTLTAVFMFCFCAQDAVKSVRIVELRVPAHAAEGGQALLGCQFHMEDDILYSLKWYKDKREFYRYVPRNRPPAASFYSPGISVDMSRSSSDVVTLVNLSQDSAGYYRCEVSGETPLFTTAYDEKYINIHLLPDSAPQIIGLIDRYQIGDRVLLNCTSSASRPETQLKWLVNDQPVPRKHLQGPWYRVSVDRPDATETILQLRFTVTARHFRDGNMKLKCQAIIAPLYQEESTQSLSQDPSTQKPSLQKWDSFYQDLGHHGTQIMLPDKDDEDKYLDFVAALADAADRRQVPWIILVISIAYVFLETL